MSESGFPYPPPWAMDYATGPDYPIASRRRTLEQRKVGVTVQSSIHVEHRVAEEWATGMLLHRLTAFVLTDKIVDQVFHGSTVVEWPETPWQMFKARHQEAWWFRWLARNWFRPVRMHRETRTVDVEVERWLTYPESDLRLPDLGRPVIFEQAHQVGDW